MSIVGGFPSKRVDFITVKPPYRPSGRVWIIIANYAQFPEDTSCPIRISCIFLYNTLEWTIAKKAKYKYFQCSTNIEKKLLHLTPNGPISGSQQLTQQKKKKRKKFRTKQSVISISSQHCRRILDWLHYLVQSRWLDISIIHFCVFIDLNFVLVHCFAPSQKCIWMLQVNMISG